MRKAIRTESQLGALGEWVDDGTSFDVIPRNTVASQAVSPGTIQNPNALTISTVGGDADTAAHPMDELAATEETEGGIPLSRRITLATTSSRYTQKLLNGMEHIHLPPGIRARLPKKAVDEFGFRRKKWTHPSILHLRHEEEHVEKSEGDEIKERQEGYFTIVGRRNSSAATGGPNARPRIGSGLMRWTSSAFRTSSSAGPRAEGHSSTSTLGVRRRRSSRSVFSRHSTNTNSRVSSLLGTGGRESLDVADDPALQPDLSGQSPFADPQLSIIMTRSRTLTHPSQAPDSRSVESIQIIPPTVRGTSDNRPRIHSQFSIGTGGAGVSTSSGVSIRSPGPDREELGMRRMRSHGVLSVSSRARSSRRRGDSVSIHDAIAGEVLAEEQIATQQRVREEIQEAEQRAGARGYLTGWMWRQVSNNTATPQRPQSQQQQQQQQQQQREEE
ncbi:hypothetical protein FRC17_009546 [Serendipita sp. 399]|nr:hypothetical protein FRC17_009546 [Serendipita sp. 399]